jgi:hypothetical protein
MIRTRKAQMIMTKFLRFIVWIAACTIANNAYAGSPVKPIVGSLTGNIVWHADTIYLLKGKVYLKANCSLTVEPGTIIKADTNFSATTLIVTRGAKLVAIGTPDKPIVFTPNAPVGKRRSGQWGGSVISGNARLNKPGGEGVLEGGNLANPDGTLTDDKYGGLNDADNSGVLKYVRIEYAGFAAGPNEEINSLTCAAVGNNTVIDYVQTSMGFDDGFEFFGGTVNAKHLVSFHNRDDDFDTDYGYTGKLQYGVVLRDSANADPVSGTNTMESDNDPSGSGNLPKTRPIFTNISVIGPSAAASTSIDASYSEALHIRKNSSLNIYNSIVCGYPVAMRLDGDSVHLNCDIGLMDMRNNVFAGCPGPLDSTTGAPWPISSFYYDVTRSNENYPSNNDLQLPDPFNYSNPNLLPTATSPLSSGASFGSTALSDPFFDVVGYRGAFDADNWMTGWTNFDPQNEPYEYGYGVWVTSVDHSEATQKINLTLSANGNSVVAENAQMHEGAQCILLDNCGRVVLRSKVSTNTPIDVSALPNGIYFATISTKQGNQYTKLILSK